MELDWVELEKKRINHVYKDEMREKIKKIEFGIKLENWYTNIIVYKIKQNKIITNARGYEHHSLYFFKE